MPLVSVLLPTHSRNHSGYLSKSISSVLEQDIDDFELIVVDDGSSDGSADTISEYCRQDSRVKHLRFEKNIGLPALTTAKAFKQSTGKYIAWQFDDCTWSSTHLSELLKAAKGYQNPVILYGQATVKTNEGEFTFGDKFIANELQHRNFIPNVSTLTDKRIFDEIGWFDPSIVLKRINDYDFWVRASKKFQFVYIPKVLSTEHGTILNDSLGNSVSLFSNLAMKVVKSERNEQLLISNIDNWKPFTPPQWMDNLDKEQVAYLTFEHFLRIKDLRSGVIELSKIIGRPIESTPTDQDVIAAVNWHVAKTKETFVQTEPLIMGYFRYVYNCITQFGLAGIPLIIKGIFRVLKRKLNA